ncbi:MAG: NosD domain-containing protein [Candidatus Odinarchaeota archaeon]
MLYCTIKDNFDPKDQSILPLDGLEVDYSIHLEQIPTEKVILKKNGDKPFENRFSLPASPEDSQSPLCTVVRVGNREVEGKLAVTGTAFTAWLDGANKPLTLDFKELRAHLDRVKGDHLAALVIFGAPGTVIENQVFNGTGIRILDSPYSVVRNNTVTNVSDPSDDGLVSAIYLSNSNHSVIENNSISNVTSSISGTSVHGICLMDSDHSTVKNNSISNLSASITCDLDDADSISVDAHARVRGIYLATSINSSVSFNSVSNITVSARASAKGGYTEAKAYSDTSGIYIASSGNLTLISNFVNGLSASARTASGYGDAGANASGFHLINCDHFSINSNTVDKISTSVKARYIYANARASTHGVKISDSNHSTLNSSTISNLVATSSSTTSADAGVYGIYMTTSSETTLGSNRINNLTSDAEASRFNSIHARTHGIYLVNNGNSLITANTIINLTTKASQSAYSDVAPVVSAWTCGIQVTAKNYTTINYNHIISLYAIARAYIKAEASVYAIRVVTSSQSEIDSNIIEDLAAEASAASNQTLVQAISNIKNSKEAARGWTAIIFFSSMMGLWISRCNRRDYNQCKKNMKD